MIRVSKTYETLIPQGEDEYPEEDRGFEWEGKELTFRELVRELRDYSEGSISPCTEAQARTQSNCPWVTSEGDTDYRTGAETRYSLHLDDQHTSAHQRRYWAKALRVAGLVKP